MAEERIIALMGATGAGKSSMIKLATGNEDIVIGHGLTSETQSIASYSCSFMGRNMTLVDTPGFDDTYRTDTEILQSIVEWLTTTYKEGTRLSGILYLHRITDVRMQGSAMRNLRVFRELCGKDCFKNVALCATFWDAAEEDESILNERLRELKEKEEFWGGMLACGSRVLKEPLTRKQAFNLIYELTEKETVTLQIQKEVVDERKSLSDCSAFAAFMNLELERQRQEHEAMMTEARRQFHEELQRRDRTLSEDLAGMTRIFEDRLAVMETTNAQLRAEIESRNQRPESVPVVRRPVAPASQQERPQSDVVQPLNVRPQTTQSQSSPSLSRPPQRVPVQPPQNTEQHRLSTASSTAHSISPSFVEPTVRFPLQEKPPLIDVKSQINIRPIQSQNPLHPDLARIHTTPADEHSLFIEFVNRRHQRYSAFVQHMTARIQLIESEKRQGRVKCHLLERKSCYLMVCTNCLRNVGGGEFYKCQPCSIEHDFVLCAQCYHNPNIYCNAKFHNKQEMLQGRPNTIQSTCSRVIAPPNSTPLLCRKCGTDVGRCYVHCCSCSCYFDMCLKCAMQGKHCPYHKRAHRLEICARFVEG